MRKRWLEKSQTHKETSSLPEEAAVLGELGSEANSGGMRDVIDVDECATPNFDDMAGWNDARSDASRWNVIEDGGPQATEDSSLKKQRVSIEDASDSVSGKAEIGAKKSATSQGVEHLAMRTADFGQFKFPWERKRLASVFGDSLPVKLDTPVLQPGVSGMLHMSIQVKSKSELQPVVKVEALPSIQPSFSRVVRHVDDLNYVDEREKRRGEAIAAWWDLLVTSISNSTVGRQSTVDATSDTIEQVGKELLDACFSLKSPGTLWKRLYGIKGFYNWHVEHVGLDWLPMQETTAWGYVKYLRDNNAPATKASTFLESCRFAWYILGVDGAGDIEASLRIKGISAQMKSKKRAWQPAATLALTEVKQLHLVLEDSSKHVIDRILCGHALHLLYGRARWSDLLAVQHVFMDECGKYFELQTQLRKGTKSADTRSKLLPVVTPCEGVVCGNWVKAYLALRGECGLTLPMEDPDHMMPAPLDETGKCWRHRYLTSEEGAEFLRVILGVPKKSGRRISSHSLKSTTMSWASKFGLSLKSRAILARHATAISNPTVLFSRDLLSPVLREYDAMLQAIRLQGFEPDKTRSGMITPSKLPVRTPGAPPSLFVASGGFDFADQKPQDGAMDFPSESKRVEVVSQPGDKGSEEVLKVPSDTPNEQVENPPSLPMPNESGREAANLEEEQSPDLLSETGEEASQQTTTSSDDEIEAQPPSPVVFSNHDFYINAKSWVIHCCKNATTFKCGRKLTPSYCVIRELHGIQCSRCFDV